MGLVCLVNEFERADFGVMPFVGCWDVNMLILILWIILGRSENVWGNPEKGEKKRR